MSRNKFVLTFMGGDDVTEEERAMFVNLARVAWGIEEAQATTLRETMAHYPTEIFEVICRRQETLVVHVFERYVWLGLDTAKPAVFHAKIEPSGAFS